MESPHRCRSEMLDSICSDYPYFRGAGIPDKLTRSEHLIVRAGRCARMCPQALAKEELEAAD